MEEAFAEVVERVVPAVVNVSAGARRSPGGALEEGPERFGQDPFRRSPRRPPREHPAAGSGVIVDPNGYILTNNHVIENAQDIMVRLSDARKFRARLVGRDAKTDLAVLKVDAPGLLPVAALGDSDHLRVGQWAIAIGNPFGLDRTVTVGIVSATARTRVGVATYENFIQTDASINPGNSGGPLLDIDGRVIGINTAIVTAGQGIGFSIPINMARDVMRELIAGGRVVRGWLGVGIQELTDELAGGFGMREREGVLVSDVMKGGPAEAAGLRAGDVIVELGGASIHDVPELQGKVAATRPGQTVMITVARDGGRVRIPVKVGDMPTEEPVVAAVEPGETWGFSVEPLRPEPGRSLDLPFSAGLRVTEVVPGSVADRAGLEQGDVILEVNRRPVGDAAALARELGALPPGTSITIYLHRSDREGGKRFLVLERPAAR
jgi:Do/DeqQ family serine protease